MYGTIFRLQPKPGKEQEFLRLMDEWDRERRPKVKGALAGYTYKLDKGGYMNVALFESREAYRANAEDPAQHDWYSRMRELLESDPEWNDGEVVRAMGQVPAATH